MVTQKVLYTDMIGFKTLSIPSTDNYEDFNAIALDTQNFVTNEILGDELFNAFSTDIDGTGTPVEQKWLDFLNGVTWTEIVNKDDLTKNVIHNNKGIKKAWDYFVYREWLNQAPFVSNFTGKSVNSAINGVQLDRQSLNVETQNRYNQGVDIYCTVIDFLKYYEEYSVDYTSITDLGGSYLVTLLDTTYLKVGDKVTIDGLDYTVTAVSDDTSFTFSASSGITFSNDYVTWFPFENVALGKKGKLYFNGMI